MNQYSNYKPSGINCLGDIPQHWHLRPFKYLSYMKGRIGWQNLRSNEFTTEGPYLITGMNFRGGVINWEEVYHITEERYTEAPEIQLKKDDILMTKDGTIGKLLYIDELPGKTSLNSHLLVFRPLNDSYYPRYLYYQLDSSSFKDHIELTKTGTTFYGITQEAVGEYRVILPPLSEQAAISHYLDEKTTQLDALIDRKRRLINLLREEKTALINEAVTKGIHPNVPMKDSGIEWLGEIPAHWEVTKAKYVSSIFIPQRNKPELNLIEGTPWITMDDVKETYVEKSVTGFYVGLDEAETAGSKILPSRSVIASCVGNFGVSSINTKDVIINQQLQAFIPTRILPELLKVLITVSKTYFEIEATATTIQFVNREKFENLPICLPPEYEQSEITTYLDAETAKIDHTISRIEREIELMQEYRTALISEVVTGKVCVV